MALRRAIIEGEPQRIQVVWNNIQPPFSTNLYAPYNTSNSSLTDNGDGIVTQTWLAKVSGYYASFRIKTNPGVTYNTSHKYYLSYMIKPSFAGTIFGVDFANHAFAIGNEATANVWNQLSVIVNANANNSNRTLYAERRGGYQPVVNDTVQCKAPIVVDLTLMFGAGNEPDKDTFEKQCAMNGIDLTESQAQNINGTQRWWII